MAAKKNSLSGYYAISQGSGLVFGPFKTEAAAKDHVAKKWNTYYDEDYPPVIVKSVASVVIPPEKINWVKH